MTWEKWNGTWIRGKGLSIYGTLIPEAAFEEYSVTFVWNLSQELWTMKVKDKHALFDMSGKWAQIDLSNVRVRFKNLRYVRPDAAGIFIAGDQDTVVQVGNGVELMTALVD